MISPEFRIHTQRLMLRPFDEQDCEAMLRIQSNPPMTRYTPDEPWKDIDDAYNFLNFAKSLYNDEAIIEGFRYFFAVVERNSMEVIGYCGLGGPEFDRTITELFYSIDVDHWGRGYATETANALLKYGFNELNLDKIVGFAEEDNIASLRVLEKVGLKRKKSISGLSEQYEYFNGECFYELSRIEWNQ